VQIFESSEQFATDDGDVTFAEVTGFQLEQRLAMSGHWDIQHGELTRSRQEPPPRYSITIHNLWPRKKLVLYCVTYELPHVLRTAISCWISWMSSSLDSRSICKEYRSAYVSLKE
jgi:hypothetical protein